MTLEPRMARTHQALATALLRLLDGSSLESITVAGLSREAGVHRTTFYGHYPDVVSFAASIFVGELDAIARVDIDPAASVTPESISDAYAQSLRQMLDHVATSRPVYRALFASRIGAGFRGDLTERMRGRALTAMRAWKHQGIAITVADEAAAAFISGGIVSAIEHWSASDEADAAAYAATITGLMPRWWPRPPSD
ncbi:TetR/AcrR family transcriptional regulator [Cryobacterium frigoriphilum]|uniref:TetR/AcrR family transcriptional regulator n=1 Tax=Cryobacterium frigoriphilum TaxID=1259150 RepID=A0A4V3IR63_9MICO|nr:TetR/AcrR family transcriptional regulator [Cryobacterium frigoriphilum]TFD50278.1 TetR/AcrR family transcriptional regulator [Cryobacterium frigoriphilum]